MAGTEFKTSTSHPLTLLRSYIRTFGSEALEWEPFVVKKALEKRLTFSLPRVNFLKLLAAISVANHDQFWSSWETFHTVSQALAGKIPSVSHIDNQSVSDLMIAVDAALRIRKDLGSVGDIPPFSEEVIRYMAAQLHESGIWYVPEPLEFLNPLISGVTQVCGECGNEEQPKEDGLCSYCTDRYNTDSLLKMEPDEELKKKFNGSKVKVTVKFPTAGVQKSLVRALTRGGETLRETEDDICAARILEGIRDLSAYTAELEVQTKTAGLATVAGTQKAIATHNAFNPDSPIEFNIPELPKTKEEQNQQPQLKPQKPTIPPKKKAPGIEKYINPLSLGGTALLAGGLLRSPNAGKFLTAAKEVVTKPVTSIGRSMRAGANYVGPGADEFARQAAQSKRVEMMGETLRQANLGAQAGGKSQVTEFEALTGGPEGKTLVQKLRKSGLLSAGEKTYDNVNIGWLLSRRLNSLVREMDAASAAGRTVDYKKLEGAYNDLINAARRQGRPASRGISYYLPGERAIEVGAPVLTGATELATSEDPDTGEARSLSERIARGVAAGGITAATGALFAGRNLGLSKKNLLTGADRSTFSAKGLVPAAAGMAVGSTLENIGADVVGGGTKLVDSAFGQKKEQT
jgi:hypothetical protein